MGRFDGKNGRNGFMDSPDYKQLKKISKYSPLFSFFLFLVSYFSLKDYGCSDAAVVVITVFFFSLILGLISIIIFFFFKENDKNNAIAALFVSLSCELGIFLLWLCGINNLWKEIFFLLPFFILGYVAGFLFFKRKHSKKNINKSHPKENKWAATAGIFGCVGIWAARIIGSIFNPYVLINFTRLLLELVIIFYSFLIGTLIFRIKLAIEKH